MKEEYLNIIKKTGFSEVESIDETLFPIGFMENDQTALAIVKNANVTTEKVKELEGSITSIKVKGKK